jgi:ABC-2 type transport system permease protein
MTSIAMPTPTGPTSTGPTPTGPTSTGPTSTGTLRPAPRTTSIVTSTAQVAERALLRYFRTPQLVVLGTLQGALFLLIFRYVFGGAVDIHGTSYVNFLVPGFVTTGVLFTGQGAATGVADDLQQGFVDRLRSLPVPRSCFLVGRAIADTIWCAWGLLTAIAVGLAVGFRPHGPALGDLAALALCVVFGFAFEWLFLVVGLYAGTPQAAQGMAFLVFPLTFVSSAYVPVSSMPGWLQAFAQHQPITYMVDAVRALTLGPTSAATLGHTAGYFTFWSLLWAAGIVAVFAPIAAAKYARG